MQRMQRKINRVTKTVVSSCDPIFKRFSYFDTKQFFLPKLAQMKSISQVNFAFYFIMLKIGFCLKCLIRCQIICDVRICDVLNSAGKKTLSIYSSYSSYSSFRNQFIVKINRYTSRACIIQYNWNWPQNRKEKFSLGIKTESNPFR